MKKRIVKIVVGCMVVGLVVVGGVFLKGKKEKTARGEVTFSKESGNYEEAFELKLSGEGRIYYTLDGSDPATSETRKEYSKKISITSREKDENVISAYDPVLFDAANTRWNPEKEEYVSSVSAPEKEEVDKFTVVKAVVKKKDGSYSKTVTHTYIVGKMSDHIQGIKESCKAAGTDLAVLSISMEEKDLFDYEKGIYVKGKKFDDALKKYRKSNAMNEWQATELARKMDANYQARGKEGERKAHVDFFESNGEVTKCLLQQDCGIRVQGNYSRSDLQKGFRLVADLEYGVNDFEYAFFGKDAKDVGGKTKNKFKRLVLRNGGNCAFSSKFNDTFWQSLVKDKKVETQASRPCVVYLNGEYWGLYLLQEDYDDNYFQEKYGVNNKAVVAYKGDGERYKIGYKLDEGVLPKGADVTYYFKDLLEFYKSHKDLKAQEDFDAFAKLVDVESVKDYFTIQLWINNKWDWPGKNWTVWKVTETDKTNPYADGRWRFCCYDMEFGGVSGAGDAPTNTIKEDNYEPDGMLDRGTKNPVVLMFIYLMSNEEFRQDFLADLQELSKTNFEKKAAIKKCTWFRDVYEPLLPQFFARYYGKERAEGSVQNAIHGGYASYDCIVAFLEERENHIQPMVDWVLDYYS